MSVAGWYPDPQDPGSQRYYDGQNWTEHHRPVASRTAPLAPPARWTPPSWGAHVQQPRPEAAALVWQAPASTTAYRPRHTGSGGRRGRPLILGLVVVLVAALLTGGYLVLTGGADGPTFTYAGATIKDPSAVLSAAEARLAAIVSERHGARSPDTHCYYAVYYAVPSARAGGARKTDVDPNLRCGPVLFVDGDTAREYLSFALVNSDSGSTVTLAAASTPLRINPDPPPPDMKLQRPDGKKPPPGTGGLRLPIPPAAEPDAIVAVDPGLTNLPGAPSDAVMGSWSGGITLTMLGPVTRYGVGDAARTAPPGQRLIGFATAAAAGDDGSSSDLASSATVSVDGGTGRPVPDAGDSRYVVVAVPRGAKSVDLVLTDHGLRQSLSLLDGTPGSGNVVVLTRMHRASVQSRTAKAVFTFAPAVVFADGTSGARESAAVTFKFAQLNYRNVDQKKPLTARSPRNAIMHVSMTYTGSHDRGTFGFPAALLAFTPAGAAPVHARNISTTPGKIYNVFEVPGNVTAGTLTLSGSVVQPFADRSGHYRFGIRTAVRIPISFPAG